MSNYSISRFWDKLHRYDTKGEILRVVGELIERLFGKKAAQPVKDFRIRYLRKLYRRIYRKCKLDISTVRSQAITPENPNEVPIWCCWFQGEEAMPLLVKMCYKRLRQKAGKHPVILVTEQNMADYVNIDPFIMQLYRNGKISKTNFSDFLRFSLLEQRGGLWIDSTVFVAGDIPESAFTQHFYSPHHPWLSYIISSYKSGIVPHLWNTVSCEILREYGSMPSYFLVDEVMEIIYEKNEEAREAMDAVPLENKERHYLTDKLYQEADLDLYEQLTKTNNYFKLTYKNVTDEGLANSAPNSWFNFLDSLQ